MPVIREMTIDNIVYDIEDKRAVKPEHLLDLIYPVGSIYLNVTEISPAVLFGGEWVQIKDRFLLSSGDTYPNGQLGGSSKASLVAHTHGLSTAFAVGAGAHTHSTSSAGNHLHSMGNLWSEGSGKGTAYVMQGSRKVKVRYTANAGEHAHIANSSGAHTHGLSGRTDSTGQAAAEANMPPYLTVYMWKRVG